MGEWVETEKTLRDLSTEELTVTYPFISRAVAEEFLTACVSAHPVWEKVTDVFQLVEGKNDTWWMFATQNDMPTETELERDNLQVAFTSLAFGFETGYLRGRD